MLGHDTVADTKPQASATLFAPGGEEGVEELVVVFGWHPGTIISKRNPDIVFLLLSFDGVLSPTACLSYSLLGFVDHVHVNFLTLLTID